MTRRPAAPSLSDEMQIEGDLDDAYSATCALFEMIEPRSGEGQYFDGLSFVASKALHHARAAREAYLRQSDEVAMMSRATPVIVAPAMPPRRRKAEDDADVLAACAEIMACRAAHLAAQPSTDDNCPLWRAYMAARKKLDAMRPKTLAGLIAKAQVAKLEAEQPDGSEDTEGGPERWAWDLVNDLIRIGEGQQ